MSVYAISDLHLANSVNRNALEKLPEYPGDWLILAGDIGETEEYLKFAISILKKKFDKIIWTPGNHDLWTFPLKEDGLKGVEKYNSLVSICQENGITTPEDEYIIYKNDLKDYCLVPTLVLYDHSFKPSHVKRGKEKEWAAESGIICADEALLKVDPFNSISDWCHRRYKYTNGRLKLIPKDKSIILINHYPLLQQLGKIYTFPRFSIWCGTTLTEKWLDDFNIEIVVYGHLHIRSTKTINGIRHEEVSLGYPRDWDLNRNISYYLRKIV